MHKRFIHFLPDCRLLNFNTCQVRGLSYYVSVALFHLQGKVSFTCICVVFCALMAPLPGRVRWLPHRLLRSCSIQQVWPQCMTQGNNREKTCGIVKETAVALFHVTIIFSFKTGMHNFWENSELIM